jgi:hypothetical protein
VWAGEGEGEGLSVVTCSVDSPGGEMGGEAREAGKGLAKRRCWVVEHGQDKEIMCQGVVGHAGHASHTRGGGSRGRLTTFSLQNLVESSMELDLGFG